MKKLLVVESPTKARTIGRYLGNDFAVVATVGHLRDLPKSKMGVDLDKDFEVEYVIDEEKKKVVGDLTKAAAGAKEVLLATDPDREGEAIAYHVFWILKNSKYINSNNQIPKTKQISNSKSQKTNNKDLGAWKNVSRITFHEITREAVEEAMKKPRELDMNLVDAQQGRRVLDRVVGYSLSPVLWKKVRRGLSAGRVQSVAVRLICEREVEIEKFTKEKFYRGAVEMEKGFVAELIKIEGKKVEVTSRIKLFDGNYSFTKTVFDSRETAEKFVKGLGKEYRVIKVTARESKRVPVPAYTTSRLQQAAARKMGWSGKQTMRVAQRLYEKGLISYHRTDSVYLSDKAVAEFREFIAKEYGKEYLAEKVRVYKNRTKNAQEAHEAIRPTRVELVELKEEVDSKERKLYEMIWRRAVATQAAAAKIMSTRVEMENGKGEFWASGVRMLFDGYLKITREKHEDQLLPELKEGDVLTGREVKISEEETNPPPRYTDASLVSSLEKQGIGRPSTYAPIISTIQLRQYVEREEGKFKPTSLGKAANEFLVKNFAEILSLPFTAEMEEDLDEIARGKLEWRKMMKQFYGGFKKEVDEAIKNGERTKIEAEKVGEKCPECKEGDLVIRLGRFGKFISCSRFPDCKYTRAFKEMAGFKCPTCGAEGVVRKTKKGRKFFGCSNYPKCKWAAWKRP